MAFEKPVIVIDNGSYMIKAGFACDNHPVSIFRTVVGRPKYLKGSYGKEFYDVFVGDQAVKRRDHYDLSKPVENGRIVHWDDMERIWHHIFYKELKVAPEDRAVILACSMMTPFEEKLKCCEVFFETLNSPSLCIQPQAVLSLYGSGYTTGISVDLGYDSSDICPVYEGFVIKYACMQSGLDGFEISNYIKKCLVSRNYHFGDNTMDITECIKKYLYVTQNIAMSRWNYKKTYKLPSGQDIDVSQEAFMAAEMMFQPQFMNKHNIVALHETIATATMKCDANLREGLLNAVVPCGGLSTIPGLNQRLAFEIENIVESPVNVLSSPESYTLAWLGGATFAGLADAQKFWVTKKQYEEQGSKIVSNKFI